ncbi:GIP [Symbiodinium sp. KB8]|nr:GIP [Symbiodinium sp. KB8]
MTTETTAASEAGGFQLPWSAIPKFVPGTTDVTEYSRKLQFLAAMWPKDSLHLLAPRAALLCEGTAFKKIASLPPEKLKSTDDSGIKLIVSTLGGSWGKTKLEEKYDCFEKAIYGTTQKADETNDSYLARHDVHFEELIAQGVSLKEVRAYILLRQSQLTSEDRKKIVVEMGGTLEYDKVCSAIRLLGSRFFADLQGQRGNAKSKTYDANVIDEIQQDEPERAFQAASSPMPEEAEVELDAEYIEAMVAHEDQDALQVQAFEEELEGFFQETPELQDALVSYLEARNRLLQKRKSRGFWPVGGTGKGSKGGRGFKGKGKGKPGRDQLLARIARSTCRACGEKGHWKAECPKYGRPGSMSQKGEATTTVAEVAETFTTTASPEDSVPEVLTSVPEEAISLDEAILDTGASRCVMGKRLLSTFVSQLSDATRAAVKDVCHLKRLQKSLSLRTGPTGLLSDPTLKYSMADLEKMSLADMGKLTINFGRAMKGRTYEYVVENEQDWTKWMCEHMHSSQKQCHKAFLLYVEKYTIQAEELEAALLPDFEGPEPGAVHRTASAKPKAAPRTVQASASRRVSAEQWDLVSVTEGEDPPLDSQVTSLATRMTQMENVMQQVLGAIQSLPGTLPTNSSVLTPTELVLQKLRISLGCKTTRDGQMTLECLGNEDRTTMLPERKKQRIGALSFLITIFANPRLPAEASNISPDPPSTASQCTLQDGATGESTNPELSSAARNPPDLEGWAPPPVPLHGPAFRNLSRESKTQLIRIHNNLGHPAPQTLANHLKAAGENPEMIQAALDYQCDVCLESTEPRHQRPSKLPSPLEFNDLVGVDGFFFKGQSGYRAYVIHSLDEASCFHLGRRVTNRHSSLAIKSLSEFWMSWAGNPKKVYLDPAGEFRSEEIMNNFQSMNIKAFVTAAAWQRGKLERHGDIVKDMLRRLDLQSPLANDEIFDQALLQAFQAKNALVRASTFVDLTLPNEEIQQPEQEMTPQVSTSPEGGSAAPREVEREASQPASAAAPSVFPSADSVQPPESVNAQPVTSAPVAPLDAATIPVPDSEEGLCGEQILLACEPLSGFDDSLMTFTSLEAGPGAVGAVLAEDALPYVEFPLDCGEHQAYCLEIPVKAKDMKRWPQETSPEQLVTLAAAGKRARAEVHIKDLSPAEVQLFNEAKQKEIQCWIQTSAIRGVLRQKLNPEQILKSRWILTWKSPEPGESQRRAKARLVVLGFQDPKLVDVMRDAPTLSKEGRALVLQTIASMKFQLGSFDIKTAFLRGKADANNPLAMEPPRELRQALGLHEDQVCQLLGNAYGRVDAPLLFYKELSKQLNELGFVRHPLEPCVFLLYTNQRLNGILGVHVDDGVCGGDEHFLQQIQALQAKLPFGSRKFQSFVFTGIHLEQFPDFSIRASQSEYVRNIQQIDIGRSRRQTPDSPVTEAERSKLRGLVGSLQYAVTHTRPDMAAKLGEVQGLITQATVQTLLQANKILRETQEQNGVCIYFLPIRPSEITFVAFGDTSFASSKNLSSHQGALICATDSRLNKNVEAPVSPLAWLSKKIPRVVRSTLSAEAYAMSKAVDTLGWIRALWGTVHVPSFSWQQPEEGFKRLNTAVIVTDCKSLFDLVTRLAMPACEEHRTTLEVLLIKQRCEENACFRWIPTTLQAADCLTKSMDASLLRAVLSRGRFKLFDNAQSLEKDAQRRQAIEWLSKPSVTETSV